MPPYQPWRFEHLARSLYIHIHICILIHIYVYIIIFVCIPHTVALVVQSSSWMCVATPTPSSDMLWCLFGIQGSTADMDVVARACRESRPQQERIGAAQICSACVAVPFVLQKQSGGSRKCQCVSWLAGKPKVSTCQNFPLHSGCKFLHKRGSLNCCVRSGDRGLERTELL